jgi:membrane associated rhomboid family serine protease
MFMLIPLGKKGSTGFPIFTIFVCVACIIVHVFASTNADKMALAFYPNRLDPLKMFTSVFTHGDFWHLVGNLFFFYSFARTIETQISVIGYLLAFVIFVLATNLAFAIASSGNVPTIGLSGVVWGYMGIFLFRYPGDRINCFLWFLWKFKTFEVPAFLFILAFLTFDIIGYRYAEDARINYVAHFSGFVSGALFRIALWKAFSREEPAPRKAPVLGTQTSSFRLPRR